MRHTLNAVAAAGTTMVPKVAEVVRAEFTAVGTTTADLNKYNDDFYQRHGHSPLHALSAIRARRTLGHDAALCEAQLVDMLQMPELGFADALVVWDTLKAWRSSLAEPFRKDAKEKWPEVTRFS